MPPETVDDTRDGTLRSREGQDEARPGLLVVFSGSKPVCLPIPLDRGQVQIGRTVGRAGVLLPDERLSRAHAELTRTPAGWLVRDLGSRNGTFVDGARVTGEVCVAAPRVIRLADTLIIPVDDLARVAPMSDDGGPVVGMRLRAALEAIAQAAATSRTLVIQGESGTGKELAARAFHAKGPHAGGRFVAVNCAAIPHGLAERLLFGARRGAYPGADTDSIGQLQAADRGVLFLDEADDLDPQVQATLLRVLETREVVPLGASVGQPVDVRVCVAAHRDLRVAVTEGRFRADLYYRLAPPEVTMPALRERPDEIPRHVVEAIAAVDPALPAHPRLVEACLLRAWPGNVRELRKELQSAAARARADRRERVRAEHLAPTAGCTIVGPSASSGSTPSLPALPALAAAASGDAPAAPPVAGASSSAPDAAGPVRRRSYVRWSLQLTREDVERTLAEHGGNVALAARTLGMQRSQLYRVMARLEVGAERQAPRGQERASTPR
jgi:DNA-binding NtrC family response regulator